MVLELVVWFFIINNVSESMRAEGRRPTRERPGADQVVIIVLASSISPSSHRGGGGLRLAFAHFGEPFSSPSDLSAASLVRRRRLVPRQHI
uniref:Uncharacterized protein n=1 Tax=Leersia perrieri TaxID=77586 RepID=A0A0D9W4K6_9ORYZ